MDIFKRKEKKFAELKKLLLSLTFCLSRSKFSARAASFLSNSKPCSSYSTRAQAFSGKDSRESRRQVAPEGCFSVYVGPEKQRFVVKTEYANHPLFKILLEDAESEYGFSSEGPLLIPCDVDLFYKVLAEMDSGEDNQYSNSSCGFVYGSCSPFNPTRFRGKNDMAKGYGAYGLLTPSRLMKMNHF